MRNNLFAKHWRWVKWLLVIGVWTLVAVIFAGFRYVAFLDLSRRGDPPRPFQGWSVILIFPLIAYYLWVAFTPLIIKLVRRFPIAGSEWWRNLLLHLPIGIVLMAGHLMIWSCLYWFSGLVMTERFGSLTGYLRSQLIHGFAGQIFSYVPLLIVIHALDYYRKYREGEAKAAELRAQLAEAQLQALKMQLHPHFLFNMLNAISELVYKDAEAADKMIANLSDMLRLTLDNVGVQKIPFKQELEFLEKYMEIERTRFGERLSVQMEIDPQTLDAEVPNMILQPIVENSVRHGIAPLARGGKIEISAARENGTLRLRVRDDGCGLPEEWLLNPKEGIGLANTRARLMQLYGARHRFNLISERNKRGLIVELDIPFTENGIERHEEVPSLDRGRRTTLAREDQKVS